jgi:hypothetical protein
LNAWQIYGRAVLFNGRFAVAKACPRMPFLFALTPLRLRVDKHDTPLSAKVIREQESGRQEEEMFIEYNQKEQL